MSNIVKGSRYWSNSYNSIVTVVSNRSNLGRYVILIGGSDKILSINAKVVPESDLKELTELEKSLYL